MSEKNLESKHLPPLSEAPHFSSYDFSVEDLIRESYGFTYANLEDHNEYPNDYPDCVADVRITLQGEHHD